MAMANQKGGVGKTTSALNLASCLALMEKKTLIVDLDPQGNASVGLGMEKEKFREANIYHAVIGAKEMKECLYPTNLERLTLCPSDNNLTGAQVELVTEMAREQKLKNALVHIREEYDYVVIDCPPSLGLLFINALNAADSFIVPMQTEYYAMEGLAQLMDTVRLVKHSLNRDLYMEGILLTMYDVRTSLHKQVAKEIREHFGEKVFRAVIPRSVKLSESPSFGRPITLYDPHSKGSGAYMALAEELIAKDRGQEEERVEPPPFILPEEEKGAREDMFSIDRGGAV